MTKAPPTILVTFGASRRATAATGPVVAIKAIIDALGDEFAFKVLASPDLGLPNTVPIKPGIASLARFLRSTTHDLLYMNSFFDSEYTLPILALRRLGLLKGRPVLIAPRGELLANTIQIKNKRKLAFIQFARATGVLNGIWLQGTSVMEHRQLSSFCPWARGVVLAEEICRPLALLKTSSEAGARLRVVFISRISEKKNLDYALRMLAAVKTPVDFEIYGPLEDPSYWELCKRLIEKLPPQIHAHYRGAIDNDSVPQVLAKADLFLLPTKGENFGYAIYEALCCGVPLLISNETPWRDLAKKSAGFDLPLDDWRAFARAIDDFAALAKTEREAFREGARRTAAGYLIENDAIANTRTMFRKLLKAAA